MHIKVSFGLLFSYFLFFGVKQSELARHIENGAQKKQKEASETGSGSDKGLRVHVQSENCSLSRWCHVCATQFDHLWLEGLDAGLLSSPSPATLLLTILAFSPEQFANSLRDCLICIWLLKFILWLIAEIKGAETGCETRCYEIIANNNVQDDDFIASPDFLTAYCAISNWFLELRSSIIVPPANFSDISGAHPSNSHA